MTVGTESHLGVATACRVASEAARAVVVVPWAVPIDVTIVVRVDVEVPIGPQTIVSVPVTTHTIGVVLFVTGGALRDVSAGG